MLDPYLYIYFQLIFFGTMGAMGDQGLIGVLVILVVWPMSSFWSLGRLCLLEDKEIQDVIGFMVDFMGSWYVFFHIKKKPQTIPLPTSTVTFSSPSSPSLHASISSSPSPSLFLSILLFPLFVIFFTSSCKQLFVFFFYFCFTSLSCNLLSLHLVANGKSLLFSFYIVLLLFYFFCLLQYWGLNDWLSILFINKMINILVYIN